MYKHWGRKIHSGLLSLIIPKIIYQRVYKIQSSYWYTQIQIFLLHLNIVGEHKNNFVYIRNNLYFIFECDGKCWLRRLWRWIFRYSKILGLAFANNSTVLNLCKFSEIITWVIRMHFSDRSLINFMKVVEADTNRKLVRSFFNSRANHL